jgi:hypothetical protein
MDAKPELTVITKTYDLILWSCYHTSRFPRNLLAIPPADCARLATLLLSQQPGG